MRIANRQGAAGLLIAGALALTGGCSGKKVLPANDDTVRLTDNSLFSATVSSVRGEKSRYTMEGRLASQTDATVVLSLNELKCYRGSRPGTLRELPDGVSGMPNAGFLVIGPHETAPLKLVCRHGEGVVGHFKIAFPKVYAAGVDGAVTGRVLARDLELEVAAK